VYKLNSDVISVGLMTVLLSWTSVQCLLTNLKYNV